MKLTKKLMALILCVLMVASVLPAGVVAASASTPTLTETKDYSLSLSFDDAAENQTQKQYFDSKKGDSGIEFGYKNSNDQWAFVTEDDGNKYISATKSENGYSFASVENFSNRVFGLSFKIRLNYTDATSSAKIQQYSIIRQSETTKAGGDGGGFGDILSVEISAVKEDGTRTATFCYNTGSGTAGRISLKKTCTMNTWYTVELIYNSRVSGGLLKISADGSTVVEANINAFRMEQLQTILLARDSYNIKADLDDIELKSYDIASEVSSDFNDLECAADSTAPASLPALSGFTVSGTNANFKVNSDGTNKFLSSTGSAPAPLNWKDPYSFTPLNNGPFEISFKFRSDSTGTSSRGLLSVWIREGSYTSWSDSQELRILNLNGNTIAFGPSTLFPIANLTANEWHNIRVAFIPTGTEMCYRFYVDSELFAYTAIVNGKYNFYTKRSGEWVIHEDLVGYWYNTTAEEFTDADGNKKYDDGEDFKDANGNGVWDGEGNVAKTSWGTDKNNNPRTPIGHWDGYVKGTSPTADDAVMVNSDGFLNRITAIHMFHSNSVPYSLDDLSVKSVSGEWEKKVSLFAYQVNEAKENMRLIAGVYDLNCNYVGFDIEQYDVATKTWNKVVTEKNSNIVFTALNADGKTVTAASLGAPYMSILKIEGVDTTKMIRVTPYTMKDNVRTYEDAVQYLINPKSGKISESDVMVLPDTYTATAFIQDFEIVGDEEFGLNEGTRPEGYSATLSWANLSNPNGDFCYGGESDKGESWANGVPTFSTPFGIGVQTVKDKNGNTIPKARSAGRIKFAHVIPADLSEYIGCTIYVTAKLKVSEVGKLVYSAEKVTGTDGKQYTKEITRDTSADNKVTFTFDFLTDFITNMTTTDKNISNFITKGNYTVSASEEWFEITASMKITADTIPALKSLYKSSNGVKTYGVLTETVNGEKVEHAYPVRPTLYFGADKGYISKFSIDDITCYIIPTAN